VIHPANKYMLEFLNICGMSKAKKSNQIRKNVFSLHKDNEIIYQQSSGGIWGKIQLIWRYGLWSLIKFSNFVDIALANFDQIYSSLNTGVGFSTTKDVLTAMGPVSKYGHQSSDMLDLAKVSLKNKLEELEISDILIDELVRVATRVNYGQMPNEMDAFVGSISAAGAGDELWSVNGGNYRIAEKLVVLSSSKLRKAKVVEVQKLENNYSLSYLEKDENLKSEEFDIVIVATPQTSDQPKVKFSGLNKEPKFPGSYHRTVATIVHGFPRPEAFGFKDNSTLTKANFFLSPSNVLASMSQLIPVDYDPDVDTSDTNVWKLFSSRILTNQELDNLFTVRYQTVVKDWLAYPQYGPMKSAADLDDTRFVLSSGLYYTSGVELAASAMEMSALAAKNVANLAVTHWKEVSEATNGNLEKDENNNVKDEL